MVKKEIEEVKTVSLAEIIKEEMQKSFGNMNTEIQSVKCDLNKTRAEAEEQRDKERRRNNVILYNVPESRQPEQRTETKMMSLPAFVCATKGYRWEFQRKTLYKFSVWESLSRMKQRQLVQDP